MESSSWIDDVILRHPVVLFTKNGCRFCDKAYEFLVENGVPSDVIHKENIQEGCTPSEFADKAEDLADVSNATTFPQLFVKGVYIGGYSDLCAMETFNASKLQKIFQEVGIRIHDSF